ncbi:exocyst complex component EXO70H1-like [Lycium ferocissimum]|uniref:exocyst complex component EXO70H1-like n=1 Tax=Lycium ferocissimum TaxID=112874 RepID=UPI0028154D44|nr:exocyst complex component EXO70H1-like [Lycium ferocissimum]
MRTPFFSSSKSSSPSSHNSSSSSTSRHNFCDNFCESLMEETIENAESIIKKWDLDASSTSTSTFYNRVANLFRDNPLEAKNLLNAVNDLQHAMQFVIKDSSNSKLLVKAHNLMQIAIKRLQKEFYTILSGSRYFLDPETISSRSSKSFEDEVHEDNNDIQTKVSEVVLDDLKSIADCMIKAGYGKECVKIYKFNRKSVINETLYYLGIEKLSSSEIRKMDWELLEIKIKNWLSSVKIAVITLLHSERILCDYVFSASDNIRKTCFSEIAKDGALILFTFPEMVTKYKKLSLEKMFRVLDLYDAVCDLWVELEMILDLESTAIVKSQAMTSLVKLGDVARAMLLEFEMAVQKDSSKAVPGGGIHPLTRYVMNYLVFLSDYSGAISKVIVESPMLLKMLPESCNLSPTSSDGNGDSPSSAVFVRLAWLVLVLLCKLDGKAQLYKDVGLSYLFLANNLNYVVLKVRDSNLKLLLGSDWILKHEMKVKEYMSKYERMGWDKVVTSMPENLTNEISSIKAKDCFNKFNLSFEEVYRKQSSWVIPDPKLRDHIKISLSSKIVPIYRVLYEMYQGELVRNGTGMESIVRFAPDDLQNYFSDLFHGASISDSSMGWSGSSSPSVWTSTSTSSSSSQGR